jgi:hypothetical protein
LIIDFPGDFVYINKSFGNISNLERLNSCRNFYNELHPTSTRLPLIQYISTMDANKQFSQKEIIQNVVDTSSIVKYLDKMGTDSSEFLNDYESEYFNELFNSSRKSFDFEKKKVFFFGPGGLIFSNKQEYFSNLKKNNFVVQNDLFIFDTIQKEKSSGYDAAIVYWNKRIISIEKVVKRLNKRR